MLLKLLPILILLSPAVYGQGGVMSWYEVATPNMGEAYAGAGALASDASTAFLNPAGMTRLKGTQLVGGGQLYLLSVQFAPSAGTTMQGGGGKNAGGTYFAPGTYLTRTITNRLSAGFSFNAPFVYVLDYGDTWAGRYQIENIRFIVMELMPSAAFRVTRWLSVGGGLAIERASLTRGVAIANLFDASPGDGRVDLHFKDWGKGYHAGLLLEPGSRTRIGFTYRSQVNFNLTGDIKASNLNPIMAVLVPPTLPSNIPLFLPQAANISLYREVTRRLTLLADTGWSQWKGFATISQKLPDGSVAETDRHFRDTWRVGLGFRYKATSRTTIQGGFSRDSSAVSAWDRSPEFPADQQLRFCAGVVRKLRPSMALALEGSYIHLGPAAIQNSTALLAGNLAGKYTTMRMPFISLSFIFQPSE